ncbi:MAG TPA: Flp family type IVb pilin [Solirubrobacteraceae bacterium]|jgi:Flp pilus assembly pilin Flp|nr:Flp family type IVb pilin [Solirubrobacteraceae bacterium]
MWNDLKTRLYLLVAGVKDEEGQAMIEYSLIVALISIAAVGLFATIGTDILGAFEKVVAAF